VEDRANLEEVGLVMVVVAKMEVLEVKRLALARSVVNAIPRCPTSRRNWWEVLEVTLLVVAKSVVDTILRYSTNRSIWWETKCSSWWSR
jgi:hypothetical protein